MHCKQTRYYIVGLLLACLLLTRSNKAMAQPSESAESFVYGVNATTPGEVFANFSPPQIDEIYLLANRVSVLVPRRTQVFFWPLTQKYQGQWSALNEPIDGVLEIVAVNGNVSTIRKSPYTVHYISAGTTIGELFIDQQAIAADSQFIRSRESYVAAVGTYRQARLAWLEAARIGQLSGERLLAAEPKRPTAFTTLSVGLQQGFPVDLPAGKYHIQMRSPDGDIIAGSGRTLHVFEARQTLLGYEVFPEERWTSREQIDETSQSIRAAPGSVIYLRPRLMHEYPALAMEKLRDAQFGGEVPHRWRWIAEVDQITYPYEELEIIRRGMVVDRISRTSYSVRVDFNQALGYEIVPFDENTPGLTPRIDFDGFRIELSPEWDGFTIRLGDHTELPFVGAERQVWVIPDAAPSFLFPLLLFTITLGLTVYLTHFFWAQYRRGGS